MGFKVSKLTAISVLLGGLAGLLLASLLAGERSWKAELNVAIPGAIAEVIGIQLRSGYYPIGVETLYFDSNRQIIVLEHVKDPQAVERNFLLAWAEVRESTSLDLAGVLDQRRETCAEVLGCQATAELGQTLAEYTLTSFLADFPSLTSEDFVWEPYVDGAPDVQELFFGALGGALLGLGFGILREKSAVGQARGVPSP